MADRIATAIAVLGIALGLLVAWRAGLEAERRRCRRELEGPECGAR